MQMAPQEALELADRALAERAAMAVMEATVEEAM
jgi:hypothetical protein